MSTYSFKELIAWQKANKLTLEIYKAFAPLKDFGFKDQIQRASISIMNNVAEGHARRSDKSFRQFLLIARGSCAEVESMLLIAEQLGYLDHIQKTQLLANAEEVGRLLSAFVQKLSAKDY